MALLLLLLQRRSACAVFFGSAKGADSACASPSFGIKDSFAPRDLATVKASLLHYGIAKPKSRRRRRGDAFTPRANAKKIKERASGSSAELTAKKERSQYVLYLCFATTELMQKGNFFFYNEKNKSI
uniref:Uncharacterized protein n=1 Tax=Pseudopediastrum sp. CL0201VA TaxID=2184484 RepID=A0A2U8GJR0_9CHLO|nr:hypothetical protein [Pseudopediastrum sp. CL0201VA]AWI68914.1 hypothetical protein [Pseudopediastrum sp. CL0201VA]